jgi:hypothetical protein
MAAWLTAWCLDRLGPGADFFHYWAWSQAFLRGDCLIGQHGQLYACHHSPELGLLWALPVGLAQWLLEASGKLLGNSFFHLGALNLLLGLMTCALMLWAARRAGAGWATATAGVVLGFCGTSLLPYTLLQVSSEAPSALALLAVTCLAWAGRRDHRAFFAALGALCGLAVGLRTHNAFAALPILGLVALEQLRRGPWGETLIRLTILGLAGIISFTPMLATNLVMTGSPLTSPVNFTLPDGGNPYFEPWPRFVVELLFSPYHGLLVYQPLWLLGLAGAGLWCARDLKSLGPGPRRFMRMLARPVPENLPYALILCLLAQVLVYASTRFWHAGQWSFGGRYFTACAPLVGLGLAYLLHAVRGSCLARPLLLLAWLMATHTLLLYAPGTAFTEFVRFGQVAEHLGHSLAVMGRDAPWLPAALPLFMALGTWGGRPAWTTRRQEGFIALCLAAWGLAFPLALPWLYPATGKTTALDWAWMGALGGLSLAAFVWRLGRGGGLRRLSRAVLALLWLAWCLWPVLPVAHTLRLVADDPALDARPRWRDPATGKGGIVTFEIIELGQDDPRLQSLKHLLLPPGGRAERTP